MMEIHITLSFKSNERGAERLAKLASGISAMNPDAFKLNVNSSGKLAPSAEKPIEPDNHKSKNQSLGQGRKNRPRPMGKLKRVVFEGLARQQGQFLSIKECGLACGLTAAKIKSTVNEAYQKGEVERDQINGVYVYRLTSVGLVLLETDRKLHEKASDEAREAA